MIKEEEMIRNKAVFFQIGTIEELCETTLPKNLNNGKKYIFAILPYERIHVL